jgi:GMP synthase (glutamine-hydrolysing)
VKPILALENEDIAELALAEDVFLAEGVPVEHVRLWKGDELPPLEDAGAVISLGGDMNADDVEAFPYLAGERAFLAEAVRREVPVLGICLGGQLLARALGAAVTRASRPELGFVPIRPTEDAHADPVLSCLDDGDRMFQWHVDTFEVPEGAVLLATGEVVRNQAFRAGRRAWGLQFHPEVTAGELDGWLDAVPGIEATYGRGPVDIRAEIAERLPAMHERSRELFRRFAAVARGWAAGR